MTVSPSRKGSSSHPQGLNVDIYDRTAYSSTGRNYTQPGCMATEVTWSFPCIWTLWQGPDPTGATHFTSTSLTLGLLVLAWRPPADAGLVFVQVKEPHQSLGAATELHHLGPDLHRAHAFLHCKREHGWNENMVGNSKGKCWSVWYSYSCIVCVRFFILLLNPLTRMNTQQCSACSHSRVVLQ